MRLLNIRDLNLRLSAVALIALVTIIGCLAVTRRRERDPKQIRAVEELSGCSPGDESIDKALVMAKTRGENVAWLDKELPHWHPYIYTTSDPPEPQYLLPPSLRGHESITYLTYITTHYDCLPSITAFIHADLNQRHNDILGPSTAPILQNLRLDSVRRHGYLNLRCKLDPGCPVGVNPLNPTELDIANGDIRAHFKQAWQEIFGVDEENVPVHVGNVCCGQFVVSREQIRKRSKAEYRRMLEWAMSTNLTHSFGVGWTFEKIWHVVFGMEPIHCPPEDQCRCDLLGWCGPLPGS